MGHPMEFSALHLPGKLRRCRNACDVRPGLPGHLCYVHYRMYHDYWRRDVRSNALE